MRFGPVLVRRCSSCSGLLQQQTMMSGNTLSTTRWTDGYSYSPFLLEQHDLIKCPHCNTPRWINDLENVGEYDGNKFTNRDYRSALYFNKPALKDYLGYLEEGNFPADRERYLRLNTWWTGNSERRRNTEVPMYMTKAEKDNLECLIDLLDERDQSDLLLKAESYRELGHFEKAIAVLCRFDPGYNPEAADAIWQLCKQRDGFVKEIPGD